MATPLVSIRHLITDSWDAYLKHWNHLMEVSLWLLLFPLIHLALAFAFGWAPPSMTNTVLSVVQLLDRLFAVWIMIRLMRITLARDPKEEGLIIHNLRASWAEYWPYFLISLLGSLAIFGGAALLFFPGVWLAVSFVFAQFFFLDDGVRGVNALAASAELVKGRWWPTFGRIVATGMFFFLLTIFCLSMINFFASLIIGVDTVNRVMEAMRLSFWEPITVETLRLRSAGNFLSTIPQAIFLPIFVIALSKLYRSLKETR